MLPRPLPRAEYIWLAVIGGSSLLDWWADQGEPDQDTLSECARRLFRTDTPAGRVALTATIAVGATWLRRHLCKVV